MASSYKDIKAKLRGKEEGGRGGIDKGDKEDQGEIVEGKDG